jgi:hypothetical protein
MSWSPIKRVALAGAAAIAASAAAALIVRSRLPVRDDPTDTDIALVSIFDGRSLRPTSKKFRGGSIVSMFGGTQLDLRRVELAGQHAVLRVTTAFGGTEIVVPEGWRVEITGPALFAGVRELGSDGLRLADAPIIQVEAKTFFGGLQVIGRPVLRTADASA